MFHQVEKDNVFTSSSDGGVKWKLRFHLEHAVSERCRHLGKVCTGKVILQTTRLPQLMHLPHPTQRIYRQHKS